MTTQNIPISPSPLLDIYGLALANDATTPDELFTISIGQCRNSSNKLDIVSLTELTVSNLLSGAGGLDTGAVAASTVYAVYVIADSSQYKAVSALMSLASSSAPTLPFEYDSYRKIGYMVTDATSDFLAFYQYGNGNMRDFAYDAPIATAVTAGAATSYTAVALTTFVPPEENLPVSIAYSFTPGAASRTLSMTPGNGTGDAVTITGQVTAVVVSGNAQVMAKVTTAVPEIDYKVANAGDAVALNVAGFSFSV